jgi:hypothetical protein
MQHRHKHNGDEWSGKGSCGVQRLPQAIGSPTGTISPTSAARGSPRMPFPTRSENRAARIPRPCLRTTNDGRFGEPHDLGIESEAIARFAGAGVLKENVSVARDTYTFNFPGAPSKLVDSFRKFYGPTMNAFEAAEENGRAGDLQKELEALFNSLNKARTPIPATVLRITVTIN